MDVKLLPDFQMLPYPALDSKDQPDDLITLKTSSSWTYCGPLLSLNADTLPCSFNTWAQATINGSIIPSLFSFLSYTHEFLSKNSQSHYWLTIRASKPTNEFDIPRWHTDDLFFSSPSQQTATSTTPTTNNASKRARFTQLSNILKLQTTPQSKPTPKPPNWKLTTTLLGPGTLFIPTTSSSLARKAQKSAKQTARSKNPDHICLSIRCTGCAMAAESVRETLAAQLGHGYPDDNDHRASDGGSVVQALPGQCVFFRVGEEEGAVHSEPVSHSDRVFVNVVPGSRKDLEALMGRWGMEFPRAWFFGLDFGDLGV
ncbi:hypothetical protein PENANT_c004G05370 [Penicillium antarcticum]|uniref:Uncharacterized protein n=1 Tax=Penicillium antarcticum TaxID=416450 RepID=A0A1V6QGI4_9EURO|nr:uncharacterized protein N7508_002178 [Penicillium antarcticum]KAJ5317670.1 hypothetical protein N7508_002178 [Penicillium antarcticum]OQD88323.1 hypothetical protein PENANT_c004G05370 [Penicillium antarcticum]